MADRTIPEGIAAVCAALVLSVLVALLALALWGVP
jgi:hypothetical protein